MRIFTRCLLPFTLALAALSAASFVSAQELPDTTRLLRFPTTNGDQIVFCYAGELYNRRQGRRHRAASHQRAGL